jgi:hypothetical protein
MDETNDLLTEVQELAWALVDEQATEKEVRRLERLLLDDEEARRIYIMCMQMHADLHFLLSDRQPRLPLELEKLMKSKSGDSPKKKSALPIVDVSSGGGSSIPLFN